MNTKRTMSQALQTNNLGAEALAFVAAGAAAAPNTSSQSLPTEASSVDAAELATAPPPPVQTNFVSSLLPAERRGPLSITVRLPAELPPALLRVAMERKLRGERPFTQQDIVAQAVREWLERNAPRA